MKEEKKALASARDVFDVYWSATKQHPWAFALVILGTIGIQIADLALPWYLREFFNTIAGTQPSHSLMQELFGLVAVIAAISLAAWGARRVQSRSIMYLELRVMSKLLTSAFGYLIGHSYGFFVSRFSGSLTHKVNRFMRVYEALADAVILQFFPTFLFVFGVIIVLTIQHPLLGAALLVWALLFMAFQLWVTHVRQPARKARSEAESHNTAMLADSISNHATVMLFSGREYEQEHINQSAQELQSATQKVWYADDWIWAGIGILMIGINVAMLYIATILWSEGLLTVGDFVLIQAYLLNTFERLFGINRELRRFFAALADAQEMAALLRIPHEITDGAGAKKLSVSAGEVRFDDVSFDFHEDAPVLHQLNLTIAAGERVALVGPSGAGKTTVTKLLLRLYDVKKGSITIDGQDISGVTQDSLRQAISFVPQEPVLFHRTLMENIRYGRREASDAEVIEAAKQAHCHEFISRLKDGYNTHTGERGIKLSGGERQRVAIARAILKNAPILVLDEATSSLDSESEALIQDALETLMRGKTVIVIAHRLSTIMKMDRIVVMQEGTVVAQGTHQELLSEEGLYKKLWSIQAGGFLDDGATAKSLEPEEPFEQEEPLAEKSKERQSEDLHE